MGSSEGSREKVQAVQKTSDGGLFVICPKCKGENIFSAQRVALAGKTPLKCWRCGEILDIVTP